MPQFSVLSFFLIITTGAGLDLPKWHHADEETKEIGQLFTHSELGAKIGHLPYLRAEENYQQLVNKWRLTYEAPLINTAKATHSIYNTLTNPPKDLLKSESKLLQLNETQSFKIKYFLTDTNPENYSSTLPPVVTDTTLVIILNPTKLIQQTKVSFSQSLESKLTPPQISNIQRKVEEQAIRHPNLEEKISTIAKFVAIEIRTLLNLETPVSPIITQVVKPPILTLPSIVENNPKTEVEAEDEVEATSLKTPNTDLRIITTITIGAVLTLIFVILLLKNLRHLFTKTLDIEAIKEKHGIATHSPGFGSPRGSFVTAPIKFGSTIEQTPAFSKKSRGKVL